MKIFIISRGYPTQRFPLNGIFEYDQAKALAALGHEVVYIALDMRSIRKKRKMGHISLVRDKVCIEAINIPVSNFSHGLTRSVRKKALRSIYRKCVKKYGVPDVVHAHFQEYAYTAAQVLKDESVPLVATEHLSKLINDGFTQEIREIGDKTYRYYDEVIAVGSGLAQSLREHFGIVATVIPNIVDLDSFRYRADKAKDHKAAPFRVLSVGNLRRVKRMDDLIGAFALFHAGYPDSELRIIGGGPEHDALQALISEKQLDGCVTLAGIKPRQEIAAEMEQSDCFALFSVSETFGVAYIEAMSMGLPVIATKCMGPEDFVEKENGVLVPVGDHGAMKEAFEYMYRHSDSYDGQKISRGVNERFSPPVIARQLEEVYRRAVGKRK